MTATSRILASEFALLPIIPLSEELDKTFQLAAQLNNDLKLGEPGDSTFMLFLSISIAGRYF